MFNVNAVQGCWIRRPGLYSGPRVSMLQAGGDANGCEQGM